MRIASRDAIREALERDGGVCLYGWKHPGRHGACVSGVIHPHHMQTRGAGGDDVVENIISLCPRHHDEAQSRRIPVEELRAILSGLYGYRYDA